MRQQVRACPLTRGWYGRIPKLLPQRDGCGVVARTWLSHALVPETAADGNAPPSPQRQLQGLNADTPPPRLTLELALSSQDILGSFR